MSMRLIPKLSLESLLASTNLPFAIVSASLQIPLPLILVIIVAIKSRLTSKPKARRKKHAK
jgi:hypothetical protein